VLTSFLTLSLLVVQTDVEPSVPQNSGIDSEAYVFVFNQNYIDYYYELRVLRNKGPLVPKIWVKEVHKLFEEGQIEIIDRLYELDCEGRRLRLLTATSFFDNGSRADHSRKPSPWEFMPPDSVASTMFVWSCPASELE